MMQTPPVVQVPEDRAPRLTLRSPQVQRILLPFVLSLLAGLLVHATMYTNGLVNPDGLWHGEYSLSGQWEASLGRWGLYFIDLLHGGVNASTLSAFITVAFIALAGTLLASIFRIKSLAIAILIPTILTCSPMVSMFITYPYCADAYALSILLAVAAVYAVDRIPGTIKRIAVGALLIAFLISLYQSSLGVVLAVAAGYILLRLLRGDEPPKAIGKDVLHLAAAVLIGMILYYALTQLMLLLWGITAADFKGASSVSIGSILQNIPSGIQRAYIFFRMFFVEGGLARNAYHTSIVYYVLAGIAAISLVVRLVTVGKQSPYPVVFSVVLIILLPLCCNIINLIVPGTDLYLLMVGGMMIIPPLLLAISEGTGGAEGTKRIASWLQKVRSWGSVAAAAVLIWVYVLSCQADASVMLASKNQTTALASRIWQQVESSEDYTLNETQVLIVGHPQEGNYPNPSYLRDKANTYAKWGLLWTSYEGNTQTWQQFFRQYLGVTYETCTAEQFAAISASPAFAEMPLYPEEGSIQTIDGVLVVKVSDTSQWAE